jgi:ketosteroid isomerase-like protein
MSNSPDTSAAAVVQTIIKLEHETMAAIKDKNLEALRRILADDFVYRTPAGKDATKDEFLKNIASLPVKILSVRGEDLKVSVYGETAILTGVQEARARDSEGKEGTSRVAFTDVFLKRQGRWLLILAYGVELPVVSSEQGSSLNQ